METCQPEPCIYAPAKSPCVYCDLTSQEAREITAIRTLAKAIEARVAERREYERRMLAR